MGRRPLVVRAVLEVIYLVVGFAFLRYFYAEVTLCDSSSGVAITDYALRISAAIGCLDIVAGGVAWAVSLVAKVGNLRFLPMILAAALVALILFSYLYWMSDTSGVLRLGQVSCSLEEDYEVGLLLFVAPFFILLTLVREFSVIKLARQAVSRA